MIAAFIRDTYQLINSDQNGHMYRTYSLRETRDMRLRPCCFDVMCSISAEGTSKHCTVVKTIR